MITLLQPADVLNKGQIYLCPFGLNIDSKRPHVFARLSYFTPECSVDKPLSNNLELIFFNRSLVHLLKGKEGEGGVWSIFKGSHIVFNGYEKESVVPNKVYWGGTIEDWRSINCQLGGFHKKITQPYWGGGKTRKFYRPPPLMNNDQSLPSVRAVYGKQQSSVLRILPVSKSHEQLYVKY